MPYYQGEKEGYQFVAGICDYIKVEDQTQNESSGEYGNGPVDMTNTEYYWGDIHGWGSTNGKTNHAPEGTFYTTKSGKTIKTFDDYMALSPEEQQEWNDYADSWFY